MRDDVFDNRCYDDLFRRVFEFEQYGGRKDIFWIELDYYITRDCFVSRIGAELDVSMKSFSGNEIFRDALDRDAIAAIPYKVIDERVEPQTAFQDIYKVTEVYGYAPPETFNSYSGEVVQFPALRDTSAENKVEESVSFRYELGQIFFTDRGNLFNVGDSLSFTMARKVITTTPYQYAYGARATQLSQVVEVRIVNDARVCYCTDVSWFIYETNTTADSQTLITNCRFADADYGLRRLSRRNGNARLHRSRPVQRTGKYHEFHFIPFPISGCRRPFENFCG